jgi:thiamine biosynthesis protein ThiI
MPITAKDAPPFENLATVATPSILNGVVIHYHEIALKRGNRRFFEQQLRRNVLHATSGLGIKEVLRLSGRIIGLFAANADWKEIEAALRKVFGIAYFAPAVKLSQNLAEIKAAALQLLAGKSLPASKSKPSAARSIFR